MWFLGLSTSTKRSYIVIGAIILVIGLTIILRKCVVYSDSNHRDRKSSTKVSNHESKSDHHKTKDSTLANKNIVDHQSAAGIRTYSLQELEVATSDFKFRIGVGATSYVYLAELGDGRFGAVKRVMEERGGSQKMFLDEISVLLRISHPNLVGLMGFCLERGEQLVLLEYVPNKSLFDRLHKNHGGALTWSNRLSIALDIAYALDYLHSVADPPVIHRDIKSSNILLINDDHAKLADFGLCKLGNDVQQSQTPIAIKGSLGYIDMNYLNTGLVSPKSDVYSFGVLILELITGLRSLQGSFTLAEWTEEKRKSEDNEVLIEMVDPKIKNDVDAEQLKVLVDVANRALVEESDSRPCMMEIAYDIATCMEMVNNHSDYEQDSAELPV